MKNCWQFCNTVEKEETLNAFQFQCELEHLENEPNRTEKQFRNAFDARQKEASLKSRHEHRQAHKYKHIMDRTRSSNGMCTLFFPKHNDSNYAKP